MIEKKIVRTQAAAAAIKEIESYRDRSGWHWVARSLGATVPSGILHQLEDDVVGCASDWNSGHRKKHRLPKGALVFATTKEYVNSLGVWGYEGDCLTGVFSDTMPETFYD